MCGLAQNSAYRLPWALPFSQSNSVSFAPAVPDTGPMGHLGDIYSLELRRRDIERSTRDRYGQIVTAYLASLNGHAPTRETALDYLADLKDRGYADKSYKLYGHVLRDFHRIEMGQDLRLKLKKVRTLPPNVPWPSVERVLAQAERGLRGHSPERRERSHDACAFLAFTGCRRSELLALRVRNVDFERSLIHIRNAKGKKDRSLPMVERVIVPLRHRCKGKAGSALVFETFNERSIYRMVTGLARRAGVEMFTPHSFRHAFATDLVHRGVPLDKVMRLMGHESLETTQLYLGLTVGDLRGAIALLGGGMTGPVVEEEDAAALSFFR